MGCVEKRLFGFLERDPEVAVFAGIRAFAEVTDDDLGSVNFQGSLDEVDRIGDVIPFFEDCGGLHPLIDSSRAGEAAEAEHEVRLTVIDLIRGGTEEPNKRRAMVGAVFVT